MGGLATGLLWLSDDLTAGLSDNLTVWPSGWEVVQEEKIFKKLWGAKHAGESVELLSEPPSKLL